MLWDELDDRVLAGFGGVSEYGITVRWDKNFLKVIRIALERKKNIRIYGGVRFGGTLTIGDAFDGLGFDHIAIAAGAGTPTIVRMKNNLIRGIRKASDFLMALQLTGAFKKSSMANLQVRLPAVVIGGGLTAIDTATELFAYYPVQVETDPRALRDDAAEFGEAPLRAAYDPEEQRILDEFLEHGRAVRAERRRAALAGEKPDFIPLVRSWGGVTIAYRKSMLDSPAYRLNHEEVDQVVRGRHRVRRESLAGRSGRRRLRPRQVDPVREADRRRRPLEGLRRDRRDARAIGDGRGGHEPERHLREGASGHVQARQVRNQFFPELPRCQARTPELIEVDPNTDNGFFTSYQHPSSKEKLITFYGDNHPRYAGNVVKAMASAKRRLSAHRVAVRSRARVDQRRSGAARRKVELARRETRRRSHRARASGQSAHADDRRSRRARAVRGAAVPARPVLPSAEFRVATPEDRRNEAWPWKASR